MLFSVDKIMKLGGKRLHGQVTSVEVDEEASIDDIKKKNQKTKKNQPTGYEGATIRIEIMLEKEKGTEVSEMITTLQRLFRPYKQKKAKLLKIENSDCNRRGIKKVYFKKLTTTNEISQSYQTATLELLAPVFAGIKVKKASAKKKKSNSNKKGKNKSKKSSSMSPAKDTKDSKSGKKKAKKLTTK